MYAFARCNVDSGEKSAVLTAKDLANLSVMGRNASELIRVLPGMAMTGNSLKSRSGYDPSQVNMWEQPAGGLFGQWYPDPGPADTAD
jgi:hypothetical protein